LPYAPTTAKMDAANSNRNESLRRLTISIHRRAAGRPL
jgi:hypothetical protein